MPLPPLTPTDRTRVTRLAKRQVTDRVALHALLDEALVGHVALVRDGLPVVLPLAVARDGDHLLLHGSTGGGLLRAATIGAPICVAVTLLDGLVLARSAFNTSMNYRSAVVMGRAQVLEGAEREAALEVITEHLLPGRWAEVRATTSREAAATAVLRLPLSEVSLKVRAGGPTSAVDDGEDRGVWAGVVPLGLSAGLPIAADDVPAGVVAPPSARRLAEA